MDVTATIDVTHEEADFEMSISNFDETVKMSCPELLPGPIYIDRQKLIQALGALEVGADPQ